jgi:Gas vesicle synthesis protein GvpO
MATTDSSSTGTSASKESSGAKKTSAKKTSAKKTPAPRKRASAPRAEADRPPNPGRIAAEAARQLVELTGKEPEGVVGLDRSDDGWKVEVEVLEVSRIPNTTDVLAMYEVEVDGKGSLQGYRRVRRYVRGVPGGD